MVICGKENYHPKIVVTMQKRWCQCCLLLLTRSYYLLRKGIIILNSLVLSPSFKLYLGPCSAASSELLPSLRNSITHVLSAEYRCPFRVIRQLEGGRRDVPSPRWAICFVFHFKDRRWAFEIIYGVIALKKGTWNNLVWSSQCHGILMKRKGMPLKGQIIHVRPHWQISPNSLKEMVLELYGSNSFEAVEFKLSRKGFVRGTERAARSRSGRDLD